MNRIKLQTRWTASQGGNSPGWRREEEEGGVKSGRWEEPKEVDVKDGNFGSIFRFFYSFTAPDHDRTIYQRFISINLIGSHQVGRNAESGGLTIDSAADT